MNKKVLTTLGLSVILSVQCIYAEEVQVNPNLTTQPQTREEQTISDGFIQEKEEFINKEIGEDTQQENQEFIVDEKQVMNESTIIESDELSEDNTSAIEENIEDKVILKLNDTLAIVGGVKENMLAPPTVINGTTLLPMRFVAEKVIGAKVDWDSSTKTVTMQKGETVIRVTIGSKIALVNDKQLELLAAPIIKNDSTLIPLRFFSENFGIKVDYDSRTKVITLDKSKQEQDKEEIIEINNAPIASFYFMNQYVAGQIVEAVSTSYDPDGDKIIDELWAVVGEKTSTNKKLSNIFKKPKAGTYTIGLKVQDSKGLWSEWTYETVTILPNRAPVITSLLPTKSSFAQGELIEFKDYTYENESWESVTEGKWTYRKADEPANKAALGKPDRLFTEGDYVVTLYLDDEYGNRSEGFESIIHISREVRDTEFNYKFSNSKIGEWIDNFSAFNYLTYKQVEIVDKSYIDGTLIMSDSPEEVFGRGILYKDTMSQNGRLLIHHINKITSSVKQRLVFVMENPTDGVVNVTLKNKAIKGPATDILRVGQLCLNEYLSGMIPEEVFTLQPGEKKYFYDKAWNYGTCISAHIDVEVEGTARFIIANLEAGDTLDSIDNLYYYPPDGVHYSGTYDKVGINYTLNLSGQEPERLSLGIANSGEWIVGYDARTGSRVENTGNFGVSHYITVTAEEDMGVILNNRGGTFQGAVKWNDTVYNMPGKGTFSGTTTKAVVLGTIKKGETVTIEYLLPNGSAAPTLLGFIPKKYW